MSCNDGFEHVRTSTFEAEYVDETGQLSFDNCAASFRIAAQEGDAPLLTITQSATANGSATLCEGQVIVVKITVEDLDTLPLATPPADPWVGWFEADFTQIDGTVTSLDRGPFILQRGI
ncbi:hypothetical protein [Brevundimonas pondensis]|uniref:Uncharacterized protein n=1 Tax=Brevundimonas pondensis TaxID=2774189 RepID=A0ABX7SLU5_9CAUL|nr:hypothetical protein [Brevundimonas pondensis]QTC88116.1 hypothetical protein IFE19_01525 [Brevundimonas pondensis]